MVVEHTMCVHILYLNKPTAKRLQRFLSQIVPNLACFLVASLRNIASAAHAKEQNASLSLSLSPSCLSSNIPSFAAVTALRYVSSISVQLRP